MRLKQRSHSLAPRIPTASMADIAFLLIIFFMLTTSFSPERTSVNLPRSVTRTEVSRDSAIVAITAEGTIRFTDGERMAFEVADPQEIGLLTREIVEFIPEREFIIKADRAVRYERIDAVLEQLRLNGARNIGLLTEKKVEGQS